MLNIIQKNTNSIIYFDAAFNSFRMIVGATSSIYLLTHGMTLIELGILKAIQSVIFFLFDIPSSYLADKYSRKIAILIATFLGAFWLFTTGLSNSVPMFFIAEIMNSISLTILGGVMSSYIVDSSASVQNSNKLFNRINKLTFFFMAIASLSGSYIYMINPKLPWLIAGSLCFIISILGFFILPEQHHYKKNKQLSVVEVFNSVKNVQKTLLIEGINLISLLLFFQIILQYWQIFIAQEIELEIKGSTLGNIFFMILMAQSASGYISLKINNDKLISKISAIISCLIPLLMVFSLILHAHYLFIFFTVIMFGSIQMSLASSRAKYHIMLESHLRSVYESFISTISKLFTIVALPLTAFLANSYGWTIVFIMISLLTIFNLFLRIYKY